MTTRTIVSIKRWTKAETKEIRVFVKFSDENQGTYYLTGNSFDAKGTIKNMTSNEWQKAKRLSYNGEIRRFQDWYSTSKPTFQKASRLDDEEQEQIENEKAAEGFGGQRTVEW